ncbi:hemoglobin-3-like [Ornithodoros turicata]|uniref:hemoglobin-3-like n=1 Tax=Ornithodoros turicata TaxID=34597 RepID=UPI003138864C
MGNSFSSDISQLMDPDTGMTMAEKMSVRSTWLRFRSRRENGIDFFLELFALYPVTLQLFPFANDPVDTLARNPKLVAHSVAVVGQVTAMVDALDNADLLRQLIKKNARMHRYRRGVLPEHFAILVKVMKTVMCRHVDGFTKPNSANGWEKFFRLLIDITEDVYDN